MRVHRPGSGRGFLLAVRRYLAKLSLRGPPGPMSRQQLQALLVLAEQHPELRLRLRLRASWRLWLQQVQALGFDVTAADLKLVHDEERLQRFLSRSQLPMIRTLR